MISSEDLANRCPPEVFLVNGVKSRVKLSSQHLVIENYVPKCFAFGNKGPLDIPLENLISVKTSSTASCRKRIFNFDVNLRLRRLLLQSSRNLSDRSIKYETQEGDADRFWTPHSKEVFGWQMNHTRGDMLIINYVSMSDDDPKWKMNSVTLKHTSEDIVANWSHLLYCSFEELSKNRPRSLLVFINPYGGKGHAMSIFKTKVQPLFREAGIKYRVVVTERANHARDMLRTDPLEGIDGVVSVGGDGMFSELFNGLLQRSLDGNEAPLDLDSIEPLNLRVGIIPGGSTNAVALALHGTPDVETSVLHVLLGDRRNIDLASVRGDDGVIHRFFMAMVSYGYFGDLIVHSERLRWLGPKRYDVSGVHTFLGNRSYRGVVQYVEEVNPDLKRDPRQIDDPCVADCGHCENVGKKFAESQVVSKLTEGDFKVVTAALTICACEKTPKGLAPSAHLGDGQMDLILVRKTSRFNYFRYLYRTGYLNRSPFDLPFVEIHRIREFSFTPAFSDDIGGSSDVILRDDDLRKSVWNCDGEIIPDPKIWVKVHCQILPVFARGIQKRVESQ